MEPKLTGANGIKGFPCRRTVAQNLVHVRSRRRTVVHLVGILKLLLVNIRDDSGEGVKYV